MKNEKKPTIISLQERMKIPVGARIRRARIDVGLTQQDVANEIGASGSMISFIEKGSQGFLVDYLILLRIKGIDINRIFND